MVTIDKINQISEAQKEYFRSGATLDIDFRKRMLKKLLIAFDKWEGKLCDAHVIVLDARLAGDCVYAQLQKEPLFFTKEYQERQNG